MGASIYTLACVTADQSMRSWLGAIARTLRFLGGVPQMIVPDNARALIADPDRYEPRAHDTVLDFARHHGVSILPARPYSPQDKAKVESAVQVVERWILARLRHARLDDVLAADQAVAALLPMLNGRRLQKLDATRASLFAAIDAWRGALREKGPDDASTRQARAEVERQITESRGQIATMIRQARARRWSLHMEARRTASEVLGQAAAYRAAPELFMQRRTMETLADALAGVRQKYVLGVDPSKVRVDIQMQQPDSGLNLADYLEKKE